MAAKHAKPRHVRLGELVLDLEKVVAYRMGGDKLAVLCVGAAPLLFSGENAKRMLELLDAWCEPVGWAVAPESPKETPVAVKVINMARRPDDWS